MTMSMGTKPLSSEGGPVRIPGKDRKDRKDRKDHDTSSIIIRQSVPENIRIRRKYTTSYNNSSNSMQLYAILKIQGDSKMLLRSCNAQKSPISIKPPGPRRPRRPRGHVCKDLDSCPKGASCITAKLCHRTCSALLATKPTQSHSPHLSWRERSIYNFGLGIDSKPWWDLFSEPPSVTKQIQEHNK